MHCVQCECSQQRRYTCIPLHTPTCRFYNSRSHVQLHAMPYFYPAGVSGRVLYLTRFFLLLLLLLSSSGNTSKTYSFDMPWPISTKLGHKNPWLMAFMSLDQNGVKGHVGVTGVKKVKNLKMLLLLQITGYDHVTHVYASAWPLLQKLSL